VVPAEVPRTLTLPRDPKDEPYLNLALAVGAQYLVSRDKDLLDLMNDGSFRQRYPDLTILA
jgi:putative PIN family toxin of toxin-antitoxin system